MGRVKSRSKPNGRREEWRHWKTADGREVVVHYPQVDGAGVPVGPSALTITDPVMEDGSVESGVAYLEEGRDGDLSDDWDETWPTLAHAASSSKWTFYQRSERIYLGPGKVQEERRILDPELGGQWYKTEYKYDALGRNSEVIEYVDPGTTGHTQGSRTVSTYDDLDRIYRVSVGKSGGALYVSEERIYDGVDDGGVIVHGVGNGLVTFVKRFTNVQGESFSYREEHRAHDWRDRHVKVSTFSKVPTYYRHALYSYNDQDRVIDIEIADSATKEGTASRRYREERFYDSWGDLYETRVFEVDPASGAYDTNKYIATRLWRNARGNIIKQKGNHWVLSKYEWDGAGRQTRSLVSYDAPGDELGWLPDYDDDVVVEEKVSVFDRSGLLEESLRYVRTKDATGQGLLSGLTASDRRLSATFYWYDSLERETHAVNYGNAPPDPRPPSPPSYLDPTNNGLITKTTYDQAGRVFEIKSPEEIVARYLYDGLGREFQVIENYVSGGSSSDENRTRQMEYDGLDRITKEIALTAAGSPQKTQYVYGVSYGVDGSTLDSFGPLYQIRHPHPSTGEPSGAPDDTETFGYNLQGELIWRRDQNQTTHHFLRDPEGRIVEDYLGSVAVGIDTFVKSIRSVYDPLGRRTGVTSWSEPSSVGGTGRNGVWFEYGAYGVITKVTQNVTGTTPGLAVEYTYQYPDHGTSTKTFRHASTKFPNGKVYWEGYQTTISNKLSRSRGKREEYSPGVPGVAVFEERFEGLSRLVERELRESNNLYERIPGPFGRVQQIKLSGWAFGSQPDNSLHYWYYYTKDSLVYFREDKGGELAGSFSEKYGYDGLRRITSWQRGLAISGQGELRTVVEQQTWDTLDHSNNWGSQYGHTVNKTNEFTAGTEVYDKNGNQTTRDYYYSLKYDGWNRLVSMIFNGTNQGVLRYNGLNRLVSQQADWLGYPHASDQYYYDAQGRLIEERAEEPSYPGYFTTRKHFLWGTGYVHDLAAIYHTQTATWEYFIQDANWNTVGVTNNVSSIKERYRYSAYGTPTKLSADWQIPLAIADDIPLFGGIRRNYRNGLYYMIHRVYDPEDGRFLHRDPIGVWTDGGNFGNGYGYVGGDPISLLDPYGEKISCTVDMEGSSPCVASETDWCKQLKGILEESQKKLDDITKNVCQGKESSTRCKTWKGIRDVLNLKGEKTYEIVVCGCENPPTNSRCEIACRKNKPGSKPAAVTYPTRKEEANRMYLCCQSLSAYSRGRHDIMKTIVHESAHIVQKHDKTQGHKTEPSSLDKQKTGTEQEEWMSKNAGHPEDAYSYEVDWTTGGSATKFDYNRDANKRYQIWRREEKGSN